MLDESKDYFGSLAAETFQNGRFAGAAAEKHNVPEGQHAPGPAVSGAANIYSLAVFSLRRNTTQNRQACFFLKYTGVAFYESAFLL